MSDVHAPAHAAIDVRDVNFARELPAALEIFRAYVASPSVSLDWQGHAAEFADLAAHYGPPHGCLVLAWRGDTVLGCAALRRVDEHTGELKRVYVRPTARGLRLGEHLVQAVLSLAEEEPEIKVVELTVSANSLGAQALYRRCGFEQSGLEDCAIRVGEEYYDRVHMRRLVNIEES